VRSLAALVFLFAIASTGCSSSTCGEGFEIREGRCVAVSALSCPESCNAEAHQTCDTSLTIPACGCAPGYAGDPCTWSGVLRDPGLEDATAWELTNGATIFPELEGRMGVASLAPDVVCSGGAIGQRVEMPPYDAAEPLVAEVTYRARDVNGIAVGLGRAWKHLQSTDGDEWSTRRFCLGEAAYGASAAIQVASSEKTRFCNEPPVEVGTIEVDRLTIELASPGECPLPGEVFNGDAESAAEGWSFSTTGGATAGFTVGGGRQGTDGVRLSSPETALDGRAAMTTKVSVPLPTPAASPSLRFWWNGTTDHFFPVEVGTFFDLNSLDRALETLVGGGVEQEYAYCLPPWTHGTVVDISFFLRAFSEQSEIIVDDVSVALDEACTNSTDIHDPGFESAERRRPGIILSGSLDQSFAVVRDSIRAHSGEGFLEVEYSATGVSVILEVWVFVPAPDESGGPQVRFHSLVPADPELQVRWVLGRATEREADLLGGGGWLLNEACLPPKWANRWYRFQIWVGSGVDDLPVDPPKSVLLDNFALTTSPACPSQ